MKNQLSYYFSLLIIIISLASCEATEGEKLNKKFLEKYGNNIKNINLERQNNGITSQLINCPKFDCQENYRWTNPSTMSIREGELLSQYYLDKNRKTVAFTPSAEFLSNKQNLAQVKEEQLNQNMFLVSYNFRNQPLSYKSEEVSFDDINPEGNQLQKFKQEDDKSFNQEDITESKKYQIFNSKNLQQNIDFNKKSNNKEEIKLIKILIKQEKAAKILANNDSSR